MRRVKVAGGGGRKTIPYFQNGGNVVTIRWPSKRIGTVFVINGHQWTCVRWTDIYDYRLMADAFASAVVSGVGATVGVAIGLFGLTIFIAAVCWFVGAGFRRNRDRRG